MRRPGTGEAGDGAPQARQDRPDPGGADGLADAGHPGGLAMTAIDPQAVLGDISGGRVLDIATGTGSFVRFLLDGLRDHGEIIGIDANPERAAAFAEAFGERDDVHFVEMDAHHLAFADGSFDTVCVSNSLHHFADPAPVLAEMLRVLRPGGQLVVNEMYRDGQSGTQETHVLLHHWWAAVGRERGEVHRETYRRAEIVAIVASLGLPDLRFVDLADPDEDPHDPETVAELEAAIERHMTLAEGRPDLQRRGDELRARLREVGARSATQMVVVGRR
jgi:SAM-dependent methyltransferase